MGAIASQITSFTTVYSIVYSDADQRKHQSSASLALVWEIHRDRRIPRTNGQLRGKCFHLMTSSRKTLMIISKIEDRSYEEFNHIYVPSESWQQLDNRQGVGQRPAKVDMEPIYYLYRHAVYRHSDRVSKITSIVVIYKSPWQYQTLVGRYT